MSVEENVELVRRAFDVLNEEGFRGLVERYDEFLTEDCVWITAIAALVEGETYRGREGFERYQRSFAAVFDSVAYSDLDFEAVGDQQVIVRGRLHLRGRGGGVPVEQEVGWLLRFAGSRIAEARSFMTPDEAVAEAHAQA